MISRNMQLTTEEFNEAVAGKSVEVSIDGKDFVLLRRDVYDRIELIVDGEILDPPATVRLIRETMADDDANDPLLESYQQYKRNA